MSPEIEMLALYRRRGLRKVCVPGRCPSLTNYCPLGKAKGFTEIFTLESGKVNAARREIRGIRGIRDFRPSADFTLLSRIASVILLSGGNPDDSRFHVVLCRSSLPCRSPAPRRPALPGRVMQRARTMRWRR